MKNSGILIINKPKGYTSRDVVNRLVKVFNTKKVGHTGTLDPLATGVLVVCMGKYTKLVNEITALEKEYIATIQFGILTDTLDITGNVLKEEKIKKYSLAQIQEVLNSFLGESIQEVPKYSAVKINGQKLYEYARKNEEVILPKRKINVFNIKLLNYDTSTLSFKVKVSKGTYIRSLIKDICLKLDTIGTMYSLERITQGNFSIKDAHNLDDILNNHICLLNAQDALQYETYNLSDEEFLKVKNGNGLKVPFNGKAIMLYKNQEIAIYEGLNGLGKCHIMLI